MRPRIALHVYSRARSLHTSIPLQPDKGWLPDGLVRQITTVMNQQIQGTEVGEGEPRGYGRRGRLMFGQPARRLFNARRFLYPDKRAPCLGRRQAQKRKGAAAKGRQSKGV